MIELLLRRAGEMRVPMTEEQAQKITTYHRMLIEANRAFNLTRVPEDEAEAVDRNYLDCAAPLIEGLPAGIETAVDVGSGAGFPGIVLAILCPQIRWTLLDAQGKRVDFLAGVIEALNLNACAVHLRAEDAARRAPYRDGFDLSTARAVAALNLLSEYLLPFVKSGGWMLAFKGPGADEELLQAENAFRELGGRFVRQSRVAFPGRDWDHRLVYVQKTAPTPDKYPRRAGKAEKQPL